MANRRLLIAYAHPDDESFGNGGLIAKLVDAGVDVYLICATDGDMGTIPEEMQGQYETVRELRLAELACASEKLGFKDVFTFGYKDSGMMGSESTEDPDCLWYAHQHHHDTLTRRVVAVIRQVQPQVVLTFNKYGGYGHPDHIAIQRATTDAFKLAADGNYAADQAPYQPQKLYYSSIPASYVRLGLFLARLRGEDPRRMGTNKDIDMAAIVDHIEPAHIEIDISNYIEAWDEASACHASQGGGGFMKQFPMFIRRFLMGKQRLTRVYPEPGHERIDEHDLFAGVRVDDVTPAQVTSMPQV